MQGEGTWGHEGPLGYGTRAAFDFSPMHTEDGWLGLGFTLQDPGLNLGPGITPACPGP